MSIASNNSLTVLVLGGGPDRERPVSLLSAGEVAGALREAGHRTIERDVLPNDLSALDEPCDVVFPVLHGPWGEGGPLQAILEQRGVPFVGCGSQAAAMAMDKIRTKQALAKCGLALAGHEVIEPGDWPTLALPLVIKPIDDGSSMGVAICRSAGDLAAAMASVHGRMMAEQYIAGRELTVGVLDGQALAAIEIVPKVAFYDYEAKYTRADTEYRFEMDLPSETILRMQQEAETVFAVLGCRHLARVDFMVDGAGLPWFLEINTLPGFTTHSLLPMAALHAGWPMPALCDRLVRLAIRDADDR